MWKLKMTQKRSDSVHFSVAVRSFMNTGWEFAPWVPTDPWNRHRFLNTPLESCVGVSVRAMTDRSIRLKTLWFIHFIKHFQLARLLTAGLGLAVGIYAGRNFLAETSNFRPLCIPGALHHRLRAAKEKKKYRWGNGHCCTFSFTALLQESKHFICLTLNKYCHLLTHTIPSSWVHPLFYDIRGKQH